MPPPGVAGAWSRKARYAARCTKAVIPMTGSPASITPSEPGSTQSGKPMTSVADQAVTPTAAVAAAQRPSALPT